MAILNYKPTVNVDGDNYDIMLITEYINNYHNYPTTGKLTVPAIEKALLNNKIDAIKIGRYTAIIINKKALEYTPNRYRTVRH